MSVYYYFFVYISSEEGKAKFKRKKKDTDCLGGSLESRVLYKDNKKKRGKLLATCCKN